MSLAEQVVEQLKTDMDNVYDAGYQKGLKEIGGLDVSKFGIQNEVTGTNIVTCDYVNENEHNLEVKLSSDTVTDFSGVEVTVLGKNLFNVNSEKKPSYTFDDNTGELKYYGDSGTTAVLDYIPLAPNEQFIIHGEIRNSTYKRICLWFYGSEKNYIKQHTENANSYSFTTDENTYYCRIIYKSIYEETIQLERGTKTPYEQYVEPKIYTANADGTVDGITSISSVMNIICDGVDISAKYYCVPNVEWHRFWDNLQQYGTYHFSRGYAFMGEQWTNETFKPKYPIKNTYANCLFEYSNIKGDLREIVDIDFSKCVNFYFTFAYSKFSAIGVIDARSANSLASTFLGSTIETIEHLILKDDGSQALGNVFNQMELLKNITVEGVIGKSVNFQWSSLLSDVSVQNIIDCLADLTGQTSQTLTFHTDVKAKLTEEQIATITSKNWTLA